MCLESLELGPFTNMRKEEEKNSLVQRNHCHPVPQLVELNLFRANKNPNDMKDRLYLSALLNISLTINPEGAPFGLHKVASTSKKCARRRRSLKNMLVLSKFCANGTDNLHICLEAVQKK